jgi:hypothetical protein
MVSASAFKWFNPSPAVYQFLEQSTREGFIMATYRFYYDVEAATEAEAQELFNKEVEINLLIDIFNVEELRDTSLDFGGGFTVVDIWQLREDEELPIWTNAEVARFVRDHYKELERITETHGVSDANYEIAYLLQQYPEEDYTGKK